MKVIDLLNKIANGEEVPKKIKYNDKIWRLASDGTYFIGSDYGYDFWVEHGDDKFEDEPITLNDEVEILEEEPRDLEVCGSLFTKSEYDKLARCEEEKKIPEKLEIYKENNEIWLENFCYKNMPIHKDSLSFNEQVIVDKLNEVIDYLKSKGE